MFKTTIFLTILTLVLHQVVAECPNGAYPFPPVLGSKWPCVWLSTVTSYFPNAKNNCEGKNGSLISIQNGYVNSFIAGKAKPYF